MVLVPDSSLTKDSSDEILEQQRKMDAEFDSNSKFSVLPFDIKALNFTIPSYEGGRRLTRSVNISSDSLDYTKLIFSALNRASYLVFQLDKGTKTTKKDIHSIFPLFIDFLKSTEIDLIKRIKVLKEFETYRVNVQGVKPQSSGLYIIRSMIEMAINDEEFRDCISQAEYSYLFTLTKTKPAPSKESDNLSLSAWISEHSWLRRDDVGIGHSLFSRLASPKATIKSFTCTAEVALLETLKEKEALMELFRNAPIRSVDLPLELPRSDFGSSSKSRHDVHVRHCFLETFDVLRKAYHSLDEPSEDLKTAIKMFLSENIRESDLERYVNAFFENKPAFNSVSIVTSRNKLFFSVFFLRELADYTGGEKMENLAVPACQGEHLLFHWVMATQTVQASDIAKLSRNDFRLIRRRDGRVTHIQLEYYKGRAKTTHETKEISTNSILGKAILLFVLQRTPKNEKSAKLSCPLKVVTIGVSFGRFIHLLNTVLRSKIFTQLDNTKAPNVFLASMSKLIENGITKKGESKNTKEFWQSCETPSKRHLFGPSSIKTCAVYASSDKFDPTQLTNYHSHNDKTERDSYLTPNNEEWMNNTGLVTRAVMQDLTVNLFRASQSERQSFNSQFTNATEYISSKSEEILARLKLVSGKEEGRVDDLGFLTGYKYSDEPSDTIYLVDSPETVLKLRHFLSEVKAKHHLLAKNAPEYLLMKVLPTVEWIEILFQYKRFKTVEQGDALYKKYGAILPPLFSAHIR